MNDIATLIKAIASILWPILGIIVIFLFRKDIAIFINRVKKGKILGQEFELEKDAKELHDSAEKATEEVGQLNKDKISLNLKKVKDDDIFTNNENFVEMVIQKASESPKIALMLLAAEIEKEAKKILIGIGRLEQSNIKSLSVILSQIDDLLGLPKHVEKSLNQFSNTRNKILHGGEARDNIIISALDSGILILKALQALPQPIHKVKNIDVPIYSDQECKNQIDNAKGVILQSESPSKTLGIPHIFPTTKNHFEIGKRVLWEWDLKNKWGETWYKVPQTEEIRLAWSGSVEFIGRNL